jgi:hypothetical protein
MNPDKQKALADLTRRGPFWICFILFLLLACDYGFRFANLMDQRQRLNQAMLNLAQNSGTLEQAQELERRLESLSLELLEIAKTNANARQIVRDFNIQWNPGTSAISAPVAEAKESR